jgi:AraC-like DNA-binding protein
MGAASIRQFARLKGSDPEYLTEIVRGGCFEYYILTGKRCEVRHQRWACGHFSADEGGHSYPECCLGTSSAADRAWVGYLSNESSLARFDGIDVSGETILYYPAGCERSLRCIPGNEWVAIEFEQIALHDAASQLLGRPFDLPQDHVRRFSLPAGLRERLDIFVEGCLRRPDASFAMIRPILRSIAEIMVGSYGNTLADTEMGTRWRHRQLLLSRAEEYLRSNPGHPFDSETLARAVGTSRRSLQILYRQTYGITPSQWARRFYLHRVRESLCRPGSARFTVEGVAREFGFTHMGRFSQYYVELFGELPSETLRKADPTRD